MQGLGMIWTHFYRVKLGISNWDFIFVLALI